MIHYWRNTLLYNVMIGSGYWTDYTARLTNYKEEVVDGDEEQEQE